jgi:thiamine kinase-like enzyme
VIDWEYAKKEFPPLFDLYNLLLSEGPQKDSDYVTMHIRRINKVFFNNRKTSDIVKKFLKEWHINELEAFVFFILFLIDLLFIYLKANSYLDSMAVIKFLNTLRNADSFLTKK